jgi:hypothetical protein
VTSVLAENAGTVGTIAYAIVAAAASLSLTLTAIYAGAKELVEGETPGTTVRMTLIRSMLAGGVFLLSIPIALWDADIAKYFWLLLIPAGFAFRFFTPIAKPPR